MPKTVMFEGKTHVFPDDFTDREISDALSSSHPSGALEANKALAGTGLSVPDVPNPPKPYALASPQEQAKRYADPMSAPKHDIIPYGGMGSAGTSDILEGAGRMANSDQPTLERAAGAAQTTGGVLSGLGPFVGGGVAQRTVNRLPSTGVTPSDIAGAALSPKTAILKKILGMVTKQPEVSPPVSSQIPPSPMTSGMSGVPKTIPYTPPSPMPTLPARGTGGNAVSPPQIPTGVSGPASNISQGPYSPASTIPQLPPRGMGGNSVTPLQMPTGVTGGASQVTTPEIPPYLPRPTPGIPTATRGTPMPINRPPTRTGIPTSDNPPPVIDPSKPVPTTSDTTPYSMPRSLGPKAGPSPTVLSTDAAKAAEALKNEMGGTPGKPMVIQGSDTKVAGEAAHEANTILKKMRDASKVPNNSDLAKAMSGKTPGEISAARDQVIKNMSPGGSAIVLKELGIGDIPQMAKGGVVLPESSKTVLNTVPSEMARSGEDILRGSVDIPLTQFGLDEAKTLGDRFKSKGVISRIEVSNLKRAVQTAEAIGKATGSPIHKKVDNLRPWHLGSFEGKPTSSLLDEIQRYIVKKPNVKVPGRSPQSTADGESFVDFKRRTLGGMKIRLDKLKDNPNTIDVLVTHYRPLRLVQAWASRGFPPSMEINTKLMTEKGSDPPASVHRLYWKGSQVKMERVDMKSNQKLLPGLYLVRHGATKFNGTDIKGNPV